MMIAALILFAAALAAVGYYLWRSLDEPTTRLDIDPEDELRELVELHRIRRRLDTKQLQNRQRRSARRLRRDLAEALDDYDEGRP